MKRQVAIIGTGWVGSSVAISTLHSGVADEVLLHDVRGEVAAGEAMDLAQGAMFYPAAAVRTATIEEMCGADVVVVTAGRGGRPGESRLALLRDNAGIITDIGTRLAGCSATIVVVSNPVDVLTHVMTRVTGLPACRVIGTGTMLDTARLRHVLAHVLDMDARSIHAQVVGEHGDSEVVLWSSAAIGGVPIREWKGWDTGREPILADQVRKAAYEIIRGGSWKRSGLPNAGPAAPATRSWLRIGRDRVARKDIDELDGDAGFRLKSPGLLQQSVGAKGSAACVDILRPAGRAHVVVSSTPHDRRPLHPVLHRITGRSPRDPGSRRRPHGAVS